MALSEAEKITVFQMLEIPWQVPKDFDMAFNSADASYGSEAITLLKTDWLINITLEVESQIRELVDEFDLIKYEVVEVKTDKVSLSYDKKRSILIKRLMILLPIYFLDYYEGRLGINIGGLDSMVIG